MTYKYDIIIPFGACCTTSIQLRKDGRQYESFPFDWMFHAKIESVSDLLINNFSNFLQRENLRLVDSDTIAEYMDNSNGISYIHDFKNRNLDQCLPVVQSRYKKRITRLYKNIDKAQSVLLIHTSSQDIADEKLKAIFAKIQSRFSNKNITLLYLCENNKVTEMQKQKLGTNLIKYTLPNFGDSFHNLLKNYKLIWKTKMRAYLPNLIYQIKKAGQSKPVIKLVCCLIPSKTCRQKMRLIFRMGARYKD